MKTKTDFNSSNLKELRHQGVFESVGEPVVILGRDGLVYDSNPAAQELYQTSELLGCVFQNFFSLKHAYKLELAMSQSLKLGTEVRFKAVQKNTLKRSLKVLIRVRPWVDQSTKRYGCALFIKDLTEHYELQERLRRSRLEAEGARIAKSQFLANISHEIRTPLNIVMGYAGLMQDPEIDANTKKEFFKSIQDHGQSLTELIDRLLEMSKLKAGSLKINKESFALYPILDSLISDAKLLASDKEIKIELECKIQKTQKLRSDPLRLKQILANLLHNAVKFTKTGRIVLKVYYTTDDRLAFKVLDSGIGIPEREWKRVFDPFSQADESMTRDHGGGGLGLAVSKHMAKSLGGGLTLKTSIPGKGSVFELWLDSKSILTHHGASGEKSDQYPNLRNAKILLVEDVIENQTLIRTYLKSIECDLDIACDGADALEHLDEKSYDLILMDLQMPRLDGFAATDRIRKAGIKTPIIALSAHSLKEDVERCLNSGFNDHLSKPVRSKELLLKINQEIAAASAC